MGARMSLQMNTSQSPSDVTLYSSPLLKLPLEIRLQIYNLVLPRSIRSHTCREQSTLRKSQERGPDPNHLYIWTPGEMTLFAVNRQIRSEALDLFFGTNVFNVVLDGLDPRIVIPSKRKPSGPCSDLIPLAHISGLSQQYRHFITTPRGGDLLHYGKILLEGNSLHHHVISLTNIPEECLRLIRHAYVVIARQTVLAYRPGVLVSPASNGMPLVEESTWSRKTMKAHLDELRSLLARNFDLLHRLLRLENGGREGGRLHDLEIVVFPSRLPWSSFCRIHDHLIKYVEHKLGYSIRRGECKVRRMRAIMTPSRLVGSFTDAREKEDKPTRTHAGEDEGA